MSLATYEEVPSGNRTSQYKGDFSLHLMSVLGIVPFRLGVIFLSRRGLSAFFSFFNKEERTCGLTFPQKKLAVPWWGGL